MKTLWLWVKLYKIHGKWVKFGIVARRTSPAPPTPPTPLPAAVRLVPSGRPEPEHSRAAQQEPTLGQCHHRHERSSPAPMPAPRLAYTMVDADVPPRPPPPFYFLHTITFGA